MQTYHENIGMIIMKINIKLFQIANPASKKLPEIPKLPFELLIANPEPKKPKDSTDVIQFKNSFDHVMRTPGRDQSPTGRSEININNRDSKVS